MYQNTALHIAAREGHVAAVRLLLARGAELTLNKNDTSFLHEALQNGRKDVVNNVIDSHRFVNNTSVRFDEKKCKRLSSKLLLYYRCFMCCIFLSNYF